MGIAALILGILAVITGIFLAPLGVVLGIVGLILGIIGIKRGEKKGLAIAGLVLSIIGLALGVVFSLFIGAIFKTALDDPALMSELQQAAEQVLETVVPEVAP